ncbi:MAG: tyrosyl-tRNA synthetase [Methanosaeta sp. NSM2]|nr:MAG: tyrosyl-tRNA synthetase [Methanosaeta sp. NSM2]
MRREREPKALYLPIDLGLSGEFDLDKLELVMRNTEEIVTVDELKGLLDLPRRPRAYVGYETSGKVHLGHMLTANKLLDLQKAGFDVVVLLADLHAFLNEKGSLEEVRKIADYNRDCFMALGLDPERTEFVYGTDYQLKPEYMLKILQMAEYMLKILQMARNTTLNRARRSMDEVSRNAENPMVSQMIYPLMQAIDIADLHIDLAVGGIDQRKIHMLAREELPRLGLPAPVCMHTPLIPGLNGEKMSSSKGNNIAVDEPAADVEKKIKSAFCPAKEVENNPVLAICKYHVFPRIEAGMTVKRPEKFGGDVHYENYEALEADFVSGAMHPMDLKKACAESMNQILAPVREKMG